MPRNATAASLKKRQAMDGALHLRKIFWILTLIAIVAGGVYFAVTIVRAPNATQQTAGILQALGCALIPYLFTKALEGLRQNDIVRVRIVGGLGGPQQTPQLRDEPVYVIPEPPVRR
jgi:hypothetical protein